MPFTPMPKSCIGERYSLARRRVKQIVRLASSLDSELELPPDVTRRAADLNPRNSGLSGLSAADLVPVR